ncbi:apc13 domain protein [Colletotrichum karsti]|uniref:Apc13 domain protein n=1 Tax=Colletotrichum karsti TaxID=1095194 RepID=A0A9P6LJT1_9PEZI|nr:apc13 domain protein [Colletotrichum karsti]KAF9874892.1 apc13 domain protein [Colletotrichum karsti]
MVAIALVAFSLLALGTALETRICSGPRGNYPCFGSIPYKEFKQSHLTRGGATDNKSDVECLYNKDASYTHVHMHQARHADLFEDFCKDKLPDDEVYVPPQHQPINPEDEDDVVPDQHAAFGIAKATQRQKEAAWKDLGLSGLMNRGPKGAKSNGGAGGSRMPR